VAPSAIGPIGKGAREARDAILVEQADIVADRDAELVTIDPGP